MTQWRSNRFAMAVHLTHHAAQRIAQRGLDLTGIADLVETGTVKRKDAEHWWIYKEIPGRENNPVCAAVIARQAIIIKTIMTHWEARDA
jgi:hypothetical protein